MGVFLSRALSFIPFDVLLSVKHGRTDALPLIWSSARLQESTETDFFFTSCSSLSPTSTSAFCSVLDVIDDSVQIICCKTFWDSDCIHLFLNLSNTCCGCAAAKPGSHFNCDVSRCDCLSVLICSP